MARTNFQRLLREVATLDSDLSNPAQSGVYLNPDRLAGHYQGVSVYDEVEQDAHAYGVLQKRRLAVISYPYNVIPGADGPNEQAAAELGRRMFERIGLDKLSLDLLDAQLKGYAVGEIMWAVRAGMTDVEQVIPRAARRFAFDVGLNLRLLTKTNMRPGELTPPRKFLVHTFGGKDNNPYGAGLGSKLLKLVRLKRELMRMSVEFSERVSRGTVIATVTDGRDEELDRALEIAEDVISSGVVAVSDATSIQLLEPSGTAADVFDRLINLFNAEMSKCVLGETGTTEQTSRSGVAALLSAHNGVRLELVRADSDSLSITLNLMLRWLTELNFGPDVVPPTVYRQIGEAEDFIARVQRDHYVAALGFKPSIDYVRENYGGHWKEAADNRKTPPFVSGVTGV